MDGIHDLGGKQGYGPIDVGERYEPLPADWQARVLGIVRAIARPDDMLSLPKRRVIGWRELPVAAQDAIVARASRSYVGSDWLRDAIAGAVRRDPRATEWSPRWQRGRK